MNLLNNGLIRLVDHMGSDLSVVRNARVSYDSEWRAGEDKGSDSRLIKYLYNNGHNTPFESVVFTFEVKAPIFVIRQWFRHRTWSFNELSARYKELPNEFYIPEVETIGIQNSDNKQMRDLTGVIKPEHQYMIDSLVEHNTSSFNLYKELLNLGMPREIARSILPIGAYSHFFGTVNLNNLFKFINERAHEHAQYEIRVYAEALLSLIEPIVPVCVAAYNGKYGKISV